MHTFEYTITKCIDHEPEFNLWVRDILKNRDHIIFPVNKWQTRYLKKTHKFGIELPKTVDKARDLDKKNGNILWSDSIAKKTKMKNLKIVLISCLMKSMYQMVTCILVGT